MSERRYDVDWLRVSGILAVFILHTTHFFDKGSNWHLVNKDQSLTIMIFRGTIDVWAMPFFFLLSGAGAWFALRSGKAMKFINDRARRLLIPFFTIGIFLLIPPQLWFDMVTHNGYHGKIWDLIPPVYMDKPLALGFFPTLFMNFWSGHLWFLLFLFEVSVLTLPVLLYLKSDKGTRFIDKILLWSEKPGGILIFLIPIILVQLTFRGFFIGEHTWADLLYYCVYFVIGYIFMSDSRFTAVIIRNMRLALVLAVIGFILEGIAVVILGYDYPEGEPFSMPFVIFQFIMSPNTWGWVIFILALGMRYLNFNHRFLAYSNEAVLPFYILHQTVILIVGWYVIPLNLGIIPKLFIITVMSFVLIMVIYELLIRRFNVVRFFFGMKPRKKPAQFDQPEAA